MKTSCEKCGSSDAVEVYEDGHEFCFSCNKYNPNKERVEMNAPTTYTPTTMGDIPTYGSYPISSRGISMEVVDFFNVKMSVDSDGKPESTSTRILKEDKQLDIKNDDWPKQFCTHGDFKDVELFGQSLFSGGRTLVITEGEIDCLSVAQAFKEYKGTIYPGCIVTFR